MKLISMKTKPAKTLRGASKVAEMSEPDQPRYPWGLEVSLNNESINKLGIDLENTQAEDTVYFVAQAKVTRVSSSENTEYDGKVRKNREIGLQIQKMAWGKPDA